MDGTEHFSANGKEIEITMASFWQWAYSDLSNHLQRTQLAEYIIASSLDAAGMKAARLGGSHNAYLLLTTSGYRVSVKCAAYVQSLDPNHPDHVSFSIAPPVPAGLQNPDVYAFCVYKGMSENDSPLNMDLWDFYILKSSVLNEKKPNQKTITLPSLMQLEPLWCDYYGIGDAIRTTINA